MLCIASFSGIAQEQKAIKDKVPTWFIEKGTIQFSSDAPLELIEAESSTLQGALDQDGKIAIKADMNSFSGFNSSLQQEHFRENYLETTKFPKAVFEGRIIEQINFEEQGEYDVRVRGALLLHGVTKQRIIKGKLIISEQGIELSSYFNIMLEDHKISIPKIMYQKISEVIFVDLRATLVISDSVTLDEN
ncbi:MAG: hypothetical protein ACI959_001663 [Limisphaerales bacterium]|jgi:hypothetical protein